MNLLVDTNILVDVLRKRDFDYEASRLLLALGSLHEVELWISPSQLGDLFYVLTRGGKKHLAAPVVEELTSLLAFIRVSTFGNEDTAAALGLGFDDLEDALVVQAAKSVHASALITRNLEDFAASSVPALTSTQFFDWLEETEGISYAEAKI